MGSSIEVCGACGALVPKGTRYCPFCGEAVDAKLVAELRDLYAQAQALDRLIAEGFGERTLREAREEIVGRYLALRRTPEKTVASPPPVPVEPAARGLSETATISFDAPVGVAALPHTQPAVAEPRGPVFSWRAFVAEQAIAIMAYLGGFLLLVATLSFEVGGWQVLGDVAKLAVVCVVYAAFGILGFALRRSTRLRTVSQAYLGVFALMTPLVLLAAYRFELGGLGFSAVGMVCVSAAYIAAIYLLLAVHTRFAPYAYLGWVAFLVAALGVAPWAGVSPQWELLTLTLASIALLGAGDIRPFTALAVVVEAASMAAPLITGIALLGTETLGVSLWSGQPIVPGFVAEPAPFAWAAVALLPLAVLWSRRLHSHTPKLDPLALDLVDWSIATLTAQASVGIAVWLVVSRETMALLLAGLAIGGLLTALILRRLASPRAGLRYGIEGLALALAAMGALSIQASPPLILPLVACLSAGALVSLGASVLEGAPWLIAVAGVFLSLDYRALLVGVLPRTTASVTPWALDRTLLIYFAGLALALGGVGMVMARLGARAYAPPIYAVALGNALYVTAFLHTQNAAFQTVALVAFTLAALISSWSERQPELGGVVTAFFGLQAVTPFTGSADGTFVAATMLIAGTAALGVRLCLGRAYAAAPYLIALWAVLYGGIHLMDPQETTAAWLALSVPVAAWAMLGVTALATAAALMEERPAGMSVPAAFGLWAAYASFWQAPTGGRGALVVFILLMALAGVGAALRQGRGPWWSVAWHGAALATSVLAVLRLSPATAHYEQWRVVELLAFGVVAFLIALQERIAAVSLVAVGYGLVATWLLPGPDNLAPTLMIVFGAAAAGVAIRLRSAGDWGYPLYALAAGASLFAVGYVPGAQLGAVEALLVVFGAAAYVIAALERRPVVGLAPVFYLGWAALRQTDAHALLPLALGLAVLGMALGRITAIRWAWPAYLAAGIAGAYGAFLGRGDTGFEPLALAALGLAAYVIAVLEARPELLPVPLSLGSLALATYVSWRGWPEWAGVLVFIGLGWSYYGLGLLWQRLPLRANPDAEHYLRRALPALPERWRDVHVAGLEIQTWGGILIAVSTVVAAVVRSDGFMPHASTTWAAAGTLVSLATLLAFHGWRGRKRAPLYLAGEALALAITWLLRALGAENTQAFVLALGSYQMLVGAFLPVDRHAGKLRRLAPLSSLAGSGLLLLPTLGQSFASEPNGVYALLLGLEALVVAGIGVGTRARLLVLIGSAFVGAAALRGAALAVNSGVPVPLVIGGLALLLMGGATWLSLRSRHEAEHIHTTDLDVQA
jgi:hypothetical protein